MARMYNDTNLNSAYFSISDCLVLYDFVDPFFLPLKFTSPSEWVFNTSYVRYDPLWLGISDDSSVK